MERANKQVNGSASDSARPLRRGSFVLFGAVVLVGWWAGTLTLAYWLPSLRPRGNPPVPVPGSVWLPLFVGVAWALVAICAFVRWRRRGRPSPLIVMWLGLAGLAVLASTYCGPLLPVIEYTRQTGRATRPDEVFEYTIEPCQLVELLWPNFLGAPFGVNDYWRNIIAPRVHARALDSLALSGSNHLRTCGRVAGSLERAAVAHLPDHCGGHRAVLGSLGQFTSPIWLTQALTTSTGSTNSGNGCPTSVHWIRPIPQPHSRRRPV